jgi:two-component sensor histidine kinase
MLIKFQEYIYFYWQLILSLSNPLPLIHENMIDYYNDIFPIFQGMMCMMLVYIGLQNYFIADKAYRFYFFHILCWLLYFTIREAMFYDFQSNPKKLFGVNFLWNFHRIGFPMLSYILYYSFANRLLDFPKTVPEVSWKVRLTQIILLIYLGFILLVALFFPDAKTQNWYEMLHTLARLLTAVVSIYFIVILHNSVDKLRWFFVIGSIFMVIFALFAMISSMIFFQLDSDPADLAFWQLPMFNMQLGVILEIVCLSLALSYKTKVIENQKLIAEQSLQKEREQREMDQLKLALEKQELSRQMTNLRMRALRSQMNPHFLFNSLNAIQECIITNQTDAAVMYLAKFSRLVRLILENSDQQNIPLSREIETLRLYLDVESLRFTHAFRYDIQVNTDIDPVLINIPPMLVQPYAENAIWHGLLNKKGERILKITFENDEDSLFVNIADNGIGRKKSADFQSPMKNGKTSMGMKLTSDRLEVLNEMNPDQAFVKIEDLVDVKGRPTGTCVKLTLPI